MLIVYKVEDNCEPVPEDLVEIVEKISGSLGASQGIVVFENGFEKACRPLEKYIIRLARIIKEYEDPYDARVETGDLLEALVLRGLARIIGIHARVKLARRTTREQLEDARRELQLLLNIIEYD